MIQTYTFILISTDSFLTILIDMSDIYNIMWIVDYDMKDTILDYKIPTKVKN